MTESLNRRKYASRTAVALAIIFSAALLAAGQAKSPSVPSVKAQPDLQSVKASPAYSEILLRKTELQADLESQLLDYTEDYPKVQDARYEISLIDADVSRILALRPADAPKLTLAVGKLIVRKAQLGTELWRLRKQYKEDHPEVKRAKKKVEIFEDAIKQILG